MRVRLEDDGTGLRLPHGRSEDVVVQGEDTAGEVMVADGLHPQPECNGRLGRICTNSLLLHQPAVQLSLCFVKESKGQAPIRIPCKEEDDQGGEDEDEEMIIKDSMGDSGTYTLIWVAKEIRSSVLRCCLVMLQACGEYYLMGMCGQV